MKVAFDSTEEKGGWGGECRLYPCDGDSVGDYLPWGSAEEALVITATSAVGPIS